MNFLYFTLIGVLALGGSLRAQETQVLAQNAQIKVELTRFSKSCPDLLMGREDPNAPSAPSTCVEMAITNNSPRSITAWIAIVRTGHYPGSSHFAATGIRSIDHILDETHSQEIRHRDTHRTMLGNPDVVEFKVAIFEDGSFFGDPAWADRIVENRRQVYQDIAVALQKLRSRGELATSDQLVREFKELAQKEEEAEHTKRRTLPLPDSLILPKPGIFGTVAVNLESALPPDKKKIDSVMSMLFGIANRLQFSQPPISSHVVPLGEPLEDASAPKVGRAGTAETKP